MVYYGKTLAHYIILRDTPDNTMVYHWHTVVYFVVYCSAPQTYHE
jgi:hypothetical protein